MANKIKLCTARIENGYSIKEAAQKVGIGELTLIEYEKHPNIIPLSIAKAICKLYKVSADAISYK